MANNPVAKHNHNRPAVFTDLSKVDDSRSSIAEGMEDYLQEHTELTEEEYRRYMMGDFTPDNNFPAPDEDYMFRMAKKRPPR